MNLTPTWPGIHRTADLRAEGVTRRDIEAALRSGRLARIARGWYAEPHADPSIMRAVQLRARVTCLSGCRLHGLWVPPDRALHTAIRSDDRLPARARGVLVHRLGTAGWPTSAPVLDLDLCIAHVIRHHGPEAGLMVLESATNSGLLSLSAATHLMGRHRCMPAAR